MLFTRQNFRTTEKIVYAESAEPTMPDKQFNTRKIRIYEYLLTKIPQITNPIGK